MCLHRVHRGTAYFLLPKSLIKRNSQWGLNQVHSCFFCPAQLSSIHCYPTWKGHLFTHRIESSWSLAMVCVLLVLCHACSFTFYENRCSHRLTGFIFVKMAASSGPARAKTIELSWVMPAIWFLWLLVTGGIPHAFLFHTPSHGVHPSALHCLQLLPHPPRALNVWQQWFTTAFSWI